MLLFLFLKIIFQDDVNENKWMQMSKDKILFLPFIYPDHCCAEL
jgi:hypothetical protein